MWVRSLLLATILASGAFALPANAQDDSRHGDRDRNHHSSSNQNHDNHDGDGRGRGGRGGDNNDRSGGNDRGAGNDRQRGFFSVERGTPNQGRGYGVPNQGRGAWSGYAGGASQDFKGPQDGRSERAGSYGREDIRPLREIVSMVRSRFGGDLINARLENGDRPFYVLRWRMQNGDVRDLTVDAASGQIR
jgi:uncharacterized membrane protein YkoI